MEVNNPLSDKARSDHELVKRAVENSDQAAYAALMARYRDSIYFMFVKMVGNKDDAEDLTIETFGKAFKSLPNYQPNFAFSTWLYRIATNNGIDFLRRKKQQIFSIDDTIEGKEGDEIKVDIRSQSPDPEEALIREQKKEVLRQFVEQLKPRYRLLIELRYYEDLSYEEIAERLNLPLGTIKAQLFRAKDLLYQVVKKTRGTI